MDKNNMEELEQKIYEYNITMNEIKSRLQDMDIPYKEFIENHIENILHIDSLRDYEDNLRLKEYYDHCMTKSDEELYDVFMEMLYQNLNIRMIIIEAKIEELEQKELYTFINSVFSNLRQYTDKYPVYKKDIKDIVDKASDEIFKYNKENINQKDVMKYLLPILMPATNKTVNNFDRVKISNLLVEMKKDEVESYLKDVINYVDFTIDLFVEVHKDEEEIESILIYFDNLTFKQKLNLVDDHLSTINTYMKKNDDNFDFRTVKNFEYLSKMYEDLKNKNKKKELKQFLHIYTTAIMETLIDLGNSPSILPVNREIEYIEYIEYELEHIGII